MSKLRTSVARVVLVCALALPASSSLADGFADASLTVTKPLPYSWAGFYFGVTAGGAWTESKVRNDVQYHPFGSFWRPNYASDASRAGRGSLTDKSFTGGVQFGVNWQANAVVLGFEADFSYLGFEASRSVRAAMSAWDGVDIHDKVSASYLGTVRGRLGVVNHAFLLYVTGGLAYTTLEHSHSINRYGFGATPPCVGANHCDRGGSSSRLRSGWTAGGGGEWAMDRNWSVKAEYLYANFGRVTSVTEMYSNGLPVGNSNIAHAADLTVQTARIGLNYKF